MSTNISVPSESPFADEVVGTLTAPDNPPEYQRADVVELLARIIRDHRLDGHDLEQAYERSLKIASEPAQVQSPEDGFAILGPQLAHREQEVLAVVLLNTRNRVLDVIEVYRGSLNASWIRTGELFREAIRQNAAAILVAHNHPSGDPTPSPEDVAVTRAVCEAGALLDVEVLDHLVIGNGRFVSLKVKGLGFD